MATVNALITATSDHQVSIERLAAKYGADVIPYLDIIERDIKKLLNGLPTRRLSATRQQAVIDEIDTITRTNLQAYINAYKVDNRAFGAYEAEFQTATLDRLLNNVNPVLATGATVNAITVATPIHLGDNQYTTYNTYLRTYWQKYTDEINGIAVNGFQQGLTNQQVASQILEQISTDYDDSALSRASRSAKTLARTATNHVSTSARRATAEENSDVVTGWLYVATLDSRTSRQCSALDGKTFKLGASNIPFPPLHPNCRSSVTYEIDARYSYSDYTPERPSNFNIDGKNKPKELKSKDVYYQELKRLNKSDQDAVLGPTLGKALRQMKATDFADQVIDSTYQPLTISQMKAKDNRLGEILRKQEN